MLLDLNEIREKMLWGDYYCFGNPVGCGVIDSCVLRESCITRFKENILEGSILKEEVGR